MSLPQEVKSAIARLGNFAAGAARGLWRVRRADLFDSEAALVAAIERAIAAARHEPVSDADKLAAAVRPWRELVERANRLVDYGSSPGWQVDAWLADAKALLEKQA